mgnify:CR=1 FL=1
MQARGTARDVDVVVQVETVSERPDVLCAASRIIRIEVDETSTIISSVQMQAAVTICEKDVLLHSPETSRGSTGIVGINMREVA